MRCFNYNIFILKESHTNKWYLHKMIKYLHWNYNGEPSSQPMPGTRKPEVRMLQNKTYSSFSVSPNRLIWCVMYSLKWELSCTTNVMWLASDQVIKFYITKGIETLMPCRFMDGRWMRNACHPLCILQIKIHFLHVKQK